MRAPHAWPRSREVPRLRVEPRGRQERGRGGAGVAQGSGGSGAGGMEASGGSGTVGDGGIPGHEWVIPRQPDWTRAQCCMHYYACMMANCPATAPANCVTTCSAPDNKWNLKCRVEQCFEALNPLGRYLARPHRAPRRDRLDRAPI